MFLHPFFTPNFFLFLRQKNCFFTQIILFFYTKFRKIFFGKNWCKKIGIQKIWCKKIGVKQIGVKKIGVKKIGVKKVHPFFWMGIFFVKDSRQGLNVFHIVFR